MEELDDKTSKQHTEASQQVEESKGLALFFELFFENLWDLIKLNLTFVLACIPLVTIGPALGGLYSVTMKMVRDQPNYVWTDFWNGFRQNWKQSMGAGVIGILSFVLLLACFRSGQKSPIFLALGVGLAILLGLSTIYLFPLITTIQIPFFPLLKNSILLGFLCLNHSIPALLMVVLLLGGALFFFPFSLPIIVLVPFSFSAFIASFAGWSGIKTYVVQEKTGSSVEEVE